MLIPLNFTGGVSEHKAAVVSNQKNRNFWPQKTEPKSKSQYILKPFYGLKLFKEFSGGGGLDRGMLVANDVLYRVLGTTLYEVASDGTHTSRGAIPGEGRCILDVLQDEIIIITNLGAIYVWNGTTLTLNTDPGIGTPNGVAVINNQAVYDNGTGDDWSVSNVGTPLVVNGLNYASAESAPDRLVLPVAYRETLTLFGERTIEFWWNSGNGNPPFDRIQGSVSENGLTAKHSIAKTPDFLFYFGSDRLVHAMTGGTASVDQVISTPSLALTFQQFGTVNDAIGVTFLLEGVWFYCLTFPTEDRTFVFPVGGEWFEWGTGTTGRIRMNSFAKVFSKQIVADYQSGNLYELDSKTYTDAGEPIIRTRQTAPIFGGALGMPGKEFEVNSLELNLQTGIGNLVDPGMDPKIYVSVSRDNGETFSTERFASVGVNGDVFRKVSFRTFGRFKTSCVFRLRVSDPVDWVILDGQAEIEVCV